jgi:hypothetical protein
MEMKQKYDFSLPFNIIDFWTHVIILLLNIKMIYNQTFTQQIDKFSLRLFSKLWKAW